MPDGPRLRELIQRAITDDAFASAFAADPSSAAREYNLQPHHVEKIRELFSEGLFTNEVQAHSGTPAYY